jgi:hypothetical protein
MAPFAKPFFEKALEKKTGAIVEIGSLSCSWLGPQTFKDLKWRRNQISGTVDTLLIQAPFWSFSGPFKLENGKALGGTFNLAGHLDNLQVDVKHFPLSAIHSSLSQYLGNTLDVQGKLTKTEVDLSLSTPNLKTVLKGNYTSKALTLKEPLVLTGVNQLAPITLKIEPEDLFFPFPYSPEKVRVEKALLNIGQIRVKMAQSLASLLAIKKGGEVKGWFAPVTVSLKNGILQMDRLDFRLGSSIHLCSWGSLNLFNGKISAFLGLPADTLEKLLGITGLSKNYVMKVEVRGSLSQPELVTGPVVAKIAALMAASQAPKKGPLKGITDLFASPKEESGVPPAKRPFPWD